MTRTSPAVTRSAPAGALALAAVLLVGLNLRGAIAAVSPVLPQIRRDLALSPTEAGLLTTLPVLCFAGLAPAAAWAGRRVGTRRVMLLGLVTIAVGSVIRVLGGSVLLLLGTVIVGAAMTVGNVLLPVVVKEDFAEGAGRVTGLYTAALACGAAAAAAATAPIATVWDWRLGLGVWALLAAAAAVVWLIAEGRRSAGATLGAAPAPLAPSTAVRRSVWRHPVAWAASLLLGLQSVAYYATTAWLPTLLVDQAGLHLKTAALAASLFQILGIPGTLLVPALVGRWRSQSGMALVIGLAWAVLAGGLLVAPSAWPVWALVGGVAQGAGISMAFTLLVMRASDQGVLRQLSGMSQLVGYTMGATGPVAFGWLNQVTGGWTAPLFLLLAACLALAGMGFAAGRPVTIGP